MQESYHNFIKRMYKEMDCATDTIPQGELFPHTCAYCKALLAKGDQATHTYFDHQGKHEVTFCASELNDTSSCQQEWYITRLRMNEGYQPVICAEH